MNIYIMDSMYFDSVEKLLPAEFAKGYKILLFYEKGRKLPDIVFEYISLSSGGTLLSPVFLRIFFYMMTLLPPIWVSVISSGIRQR